MLISRSRPFTPTDPPAVAAVGAAPTANRLRPTGVQAPAADLDAAALARLATLDPSGQSRLIERVLTAFRMSADRLMPQLDAAQLSGDRNAIRLVAHTLKSSSASIGALALSQRCAHIETAIREAAPGDTRPENSANPTNLDADLAALRQDLASALQAIERLLPDGPS